MLDLNDIVPRFNEVVCFEVLKNLEKVSHEFVLCVGEFFNHQIRLIPDRPKHLNDEY